MGMRVVEISHDGRHLSKDRGFLKVSEVGEEVGRVPLDDLLAVIGTAHGLTFSKSLVCALAERGVPFVFCGPNFLPMGYLQAVESHHHQGGRIADQAAASLPTKKRVWAAIVRSKIEQQTGALERIGVDPQGLGLLARKVRSGDPDNVEAQAARRYWPLFMGAGFTRDRGADGANALLNYGYTVLRSATARAVMAAGLHPSLGLGHIGRHNAFGLVDDLMEPFRPQIDLTVREIIEDSGTEVDKAARARLAGTMTVDLPTAAGMTPLFLCLERLAFSLAKVFENGGGLDFPKRPTPLGT